MRLLDLFSGIGGFSLGLECGGFFTTRFVEKDERARSVLAKHWPHVSRGDDVSTETYYEGQYNAIAGGFPCQDVSQAGKRAGLSGQRSGLWREFLRAIRVVRPKVAFVENVAALRRRGLGTVLGDLAEIGYDAEWDGGSELPDEQVRVFGPMGSPLSHALARMGSGAGRKWDSEPQVCRVVDGLPSEIHEIRQLGNAVCPRIPQAIGEAYMNTLIDKALF